MEPLTFSKSIIEYVEDKYGPKISLKGRLDEKYPNEAFQIWFDSLNQHLLENHINLIKLDVFGLDYINSTCLSELVKWIVKLKKIVEDNKIKILIITNNSLSWQKSSFNILSTVGGDLIDLR